MLGLDLPYIVNNGLAGGFALLLGWCGVKASKSMEGWFPKASIWLSNHPNWRDCFLVWSGSFMACTTMVILDAREDWLAEQDRAAQVGAADQPALQQRDR